MRKFTLQMLFSSLLISVSFPTWPNDELTIFSTESVAQNHCPRDEVVWLDLHGNVWRPKGNTQYGQTLNGVYVCKKEVENFDVKTRGRFRQAYGKFSDDLRQ